MCALEGRSLSPPASTWHYWLSLELNKFLALHYMLAKRVCTCAAMHECVYFLSSMYIKQLGLSQISCKLLFTPLLFWDWPLLAPYGFWTEHLWSLLVLCKMYCMIIAGAQAPSVKFSELFKLVGFFTSWLSNISMQVLLKLSVRLHFCRYSPYSSCWRSRSGFRTA